MEHSLSPLELRRSWRTTALVASAVAVVALAVLIALGVALLGEPVAERVQQTARGPAFPAPATPPPPRTAGEALPTPSRADTSVLVLNGNGRSGAAAETATRVGGAGYLVAGTANAPTSGYRRSLVMYRPGRRMEAKRLASDLGVRVVGPLDGLRPGQLMGAHIVLIVGA